MSQSYIYILANKYLTTFYIAVTSELSKRIIEHKEGLASKFTKRYTITDLVYYEKFSEINQAIDREKKLKNCCKEWKINLIKELNPTLKILDY